MKKWTTEELEQAKTLLIDGFRYEEIGIVLNRTERSIKNKLEEFGFKFYKFNPTKEIRECLKCKNKFEVLKTDVKKFCGSSCSASFNNKIFKKKNKKNKKCLNCTNDLVSYRNLAKFCKHECRTEYNKKEKFRLIEKGDISLDFRWYKKYLIEKYGEKCMECGWREKNKFSDSVPIEMEHIDGNSDNNSLKNLKLLCPNCHSLTPTSKSLNRGNGRYARRKRYKEGKSS